MVFYSALKDATPFALALPATLLTYAFQRRISYLQTLRSLYSDITNAISRAIQYTKSGERELAEWDVVLSDISRVIEGVRAVYVNLNETSDNRGIYPFQPLKDIHKALLSCPPGTDEPDRERIESLVTANWQDVRRRFLLEFDRSVPTWPVTTYHPSGS